MRSKSSIQSHPIHPMLVRFPIAQISNGEVYVQPPEPMEIGPRKAA